MASASSGPSRRQRQQEYRDFLDAQVREKNKRPWPPGTPKSGQGVGLPPLGPSNVQNGYGHAVPGRGRELLGRRSVEADAETLREEPQTHPIQLGGDRQAQGSLPSGRQRFLFKKDGQSDAYPGPRSLQSAVDALDRRLALLGDEVARRGAEESNQEHRMVELRQREAHAVRALVDRVQVLENEAAQGRASRAHLEQLLAERSDSHSAALIHRLQEELSAERSMREQQGTELNDAKASIRALGHEISTLQRSLKEVSADAQERARLLELSLEQERTRTNEGVKREAEERGVRDGLRNALEERFQVVEGGLDALRQSMRDAQASNQGVHESLSRLRGEISEGVRAQMQDVVRLEVAAADNERRKVEKSTKPDAWQNNVMQRQLETTMEAVERRVASMEDLVRREGTKHRQDNEEAQAIMRREVQATRVLAEELGERAIGMIKQVRAEFVSGLNDMETKVTSATESSLSTLRDDRHRVSERLMAVAQSLQTIERETGGKLHELEQVLSAEIQARRGAEKTLMNGILEKAGLKTLDIRREAQGLASRFKALEGTVEGLRDRCGTQGKELEALCDSVPRMQTELLQLTGNHNQTRIDLKAGLEGFEKKSEQRSGVVDQALQQHSARLETHGLDLARMQHAMGMFKNAIEGTLEERWRRHTEDTRKKEANLRARVDSHVQTMESGARALSDQVSEDLQRTVATMEDKIQAFQALSGKQIKNLTATVNSCAEGSANLENQVQGQMTEFRGDVWEQLRTSKASAEDRMNRYQTDIQGRLKSTEEQLRTCHEQLKGQEDTLKSGIQDCKGLVEGTLEQAQARLESSIAEEGRALRSVVTVAVKNEQASRIDALRCAKEQTISDLEAFRAEMEVLRREDTASCMEHCGRLIDREMRQRRTAIQSIHEENRHIQTREEVSRCLAAIVDTVADLETAKITDQSEAKFVQKWADTTATISRMQTHIGEMVTEVNEAIEDKVGAEGMAWRDGVYRCETELASRMQISDTVRGLLSSMCTEVAARAEQEEKKLICTALHALAKTKAR